MRAIVKYPLDIGVTHLVLPVGAQFRYFGAQRDQLFAWFEIDDEVPLGDPRKHHVVGTGHRILPGGEYRGTVQVDQFVWHLYEL